MIWNEEAECMSREEMEELQLANLKRVVDYAYNCVPFYRKRFDEIGLRPEHIQNLKDIEKIPFTTKDDLRENYPFNLFACPMKKIIRLHASSGTTGKPVVVGYTRKDLENWTECVARIIVAAGGREDDLAQIVFGYGLFTGGFGLHYGLEKVGITVLPMSSGNSERQLMMMQDFGSTIVVGTPSYVLYLSEVAEEMGLKKGKFQTEIRPFWWGRSNYFHEGRTGRTLGNSGHPELRLDGDYRARCVWRMYLSGWYAY